MAGINHLKIQMNIQNTEYSAVPDRLVNARWKQPSLKPCNLLTEFVQLPQPASSDPRRMSQPRVSHAEDSHLWTANRETGYRSGYRIYMGITVSARASTYVCLPQQQPPAAPLLPLPNNCHRQQRSSQPPPLYPLPGRTPR